MIVRPVSSHAYYHKELRDADENFEYREATLSHTLRRRHPALGGRSYAEAFFHALRPRAGIRAFRHVLELGGGRGDFARQFVRAWRRHAPATAGSYTIVDLAPALLQSQRRLAGPRAVRLVQGDAQRLPLRTGSFDGLVVGNEMIADLDAWEVTRSSGANGVLRYRGRRSHARRAAAVRDCFRRYRMASLLRHRSTIVPAGLLGMLEELHRVVTPASRIVLTEYFDLETGGRINWFDEHVECAYSLDLVCALAQRAGFSVRTMAVSDFLDLRVTAPVMTKRLGGMLRHILGHDVSITDPRSERELAQVVGSQFRGARDGWMSRAELQEFASAFHLIVLRKRPALDGAHMDARTVVRKEPHVRKIVTRDGRRVLVTAFPLSCRRMNEAGEAVWDAIDGARTAGAIARRLAGAYGISQGRALSDTLEFLRAAARAYYVA